MDENRPLSFDDEHWDVPDLVPVPRWRLRCLAVLCVLLALTVLLPIRNLYDNSAESLYSVAMRAPGAERLLAFAVLWGHGAMGLLAGMACLRLSLTPTILTRPIGNAVPVILAGILSFRWPPFIVFLFIAEGLPPDYDSFISLFLFSLGAVLCLVWPTRKIPKCVYAALAAGLDSMALCSVLFLEVFHRTRTLYLSFYLWPIVSIALIVMAWVCLRPYREQRRREEEYRARRLEGERIA